MILSLLKLDEQLVMNKFAKVAVQSTNKKQAQKKQKAEVTQIPLQHLQSSFLRRNRQQVKGQKASKDVESDGLLQTVKEKRQRKKPNEKKEQKKKTLNRTEHPIIIQILQRQKRQRRNRKNGKITPAEEKILKTKFTSKGPALFDTVQKLKDESKFLRSKMKLFLHTELAYTKNRTVRHKTLRVKVIVYDIDKIWSIDLAYFDKVADYNKNIKYIMVALDCMSSYLRVQPLKSKYVISTAEAFKQMIKA